MSDENEFQEMRERLRKLEEDGRLLQEKINEFGRNLENILKKEKPPD